MGCFGVDEGSWRIPIEEEEEDRKSVELQGAP